MKTDWPFADPENVAVITLRRIIEGGKPILYVTHEDDDGSWLFLDGETVREEDAMVVSLKYMVVKDPSLMELADLPFGWTAERIGSGTPWKRSKKPKE